MANFKKLAMLCTALLATATLAAGCDMPFGNIFGSEDSASNSESTSTSESADESDDSSNDSSSESADDSSSGDVEETDAYYTLIVDGASASLTGESDWTDAYGEITFNAEEAGTYGIYAVDADFAEAGVYFILKDNETDNSATKYIFDVAEAGEVTLTTNYFFYSAETLNFNYYIYKLDTLTVTEAEGTAELCANLPVPVEVVAPAAGKYVLSITNSVVWAKDMEDLAAGGIMSTKYEFNFSEAGETLSCYVVMENMNIEGFNFEWTFAEKSIPALVEGDNELNTPNGEVVEVTFTPATSGTYTFTATSENTMFGVWCEEYGGYIDYSVSNYANVYNAALEANVTYTIFVQYSNWEDESDIVENINISGFASDDVSNLTEVGSYTFEATLEGVTITFTAPEAGNYSFLDANGYSFWFDGSEEETDYAEFYLNAGESVSFISKYDGIVTLSVEKLPEVVTLDLGETVANVPAGENELQFSVDNGEYTLTWDNDSVIVYVNGMPYTEGSMFSINYYSSYAITTEDGNAINDVTFTLTAFVYPTVEIGDNTVTVGTEETIFKFDAIQVGCYTFTLTGDAINYVSVDSSSAINYPDSLEAAGSISINVKATDSISLVVSASEECEISVNVAYNTVINGFEGSVTMDDEGMNPVSLTIDSIAPGECIYFAASRMVGDYVLTWSDEYEIVVYAGENVGMSYDPQVRLTRTMMDGPVYIIIRCLNYVETAYENIVLNIAPYVEPAAEPQGQVVALGEETTISIGAWSDVIISFIAEEAGSYTLTTESSVLVDLWYYNENWQAYDRAWVNYIDSAEGGSYTFTMEAGQIIDFFVMEYDMGEVDFVFTITKN